MESTLGPYPRVIALTQGMINNGLKNVFNSYEQLRGLEYLDHDSQLWDIRIDLLPPQVLISKSGINFQFCIKLGQIKGPAGPKQIAVEVAGWTLSHALDTRALLEFREAVEPWDAGGMAGDFSPERIYAILLASIADGIVVDLDESRCMPPIPAGGAGGVGGGAKKDCSWREWAEGHAVEAEMLLEVFKEWPRKLKNQGFNPLGVRFDLDALPELEDGTMIAIGSHNESRQLFEHFSYSQLQAVVSKADAKLNSILVCGSASASPTSQAVQVDVDSKLFSTNFISDALHSTGHDITFGFWTLNRKHYLEDFVLSRVNVLHEAAEIIVDPPTWGPYENGEIGEERYHPVYKLKRDFAHKDDDGRLVSPMAFSRTGSCYTWTTNSGSGVDQIKHDQPKLDLRNVYSSTATHSSVASWTPGKDTLTVNLKTSISIVSDWFEIKSGTQSGSFRRNCSIAWHIVLKFVIINNVLHIQITEAPHHKQEGNKILTTVNNVGSFGIKGDYEPGLDTRLKKFIEGSLEPSIKRASELFQKELEYATTLIPPERRDIDLAKAVLNGTGDLIVGIEFKSSRSIKDLVLIHDLGPVQPAVPLPPRPPTPPPVRTALLEWSYKFTFNEERTRAQLVLSGTNLSFDELGVGFIEFSFTSAQGSPDTLFSTNKLPYKNDRVTLAAGSVEATLQDPTSDGNNIKVSLDVVPVPPESTVEIEVDAISEAKPGVYLVSVTESWRDPEDDSRWQRQGLKDIIKVVVQ